MDAQGRSKGCSIGGAAVLRCCGVGGVAVVFAVGVAGGVACGGLVEGNGDTVFVPACGVVENLREAG
ncbi:hypothetical protein SAMN05421878_1135 [Actinobaculum suis]|uniref:Uncharacterized protein n=1 Tax=Actinobaculum suis TaxID=1657 RepID=A0A1G7DTR0_9ACTO|nr:hypothetical protein SAMN05421878_1135 [Actinobaculum suis]